MIIPLDDLQIGKITEVKRIIGGLSLQNRLASLNIRIGKNIKMIVAQPFMGPVVIELDGRKITLGRGIAKKIFVEEK